MLELSEAAKQAGTYDVWGEAPLDQVTVKVRFPLTLREARSYELPGGCIV